jgi:hypothetical protein
MSERAEDADDDERRRKRKGNEELVEDIGNSVDIVQGRTSIHLDKGMMAYSSSRSAHDRYVQTRSMLQTVFA